jgi:hypothetical protein
MSIDCFGSSLLRSILAAELDRVFQMSDVNRQALRTPLRLLRTAQRNHLALSDALNLFLLLAAFHFCFAILDLSIQCSSDPIACFAVL